MSVIKMEDLERALLLAEHDGRVVMLLTPPGKLGAEIQLVPYSFESRELAEKFRTNGTILERTSRATYIEPRELDTEQLRRVKRWPLIPVKTRR